MEEKFICKYCQSERKNKNSLHNHERLCKLNPNRQISSFVAYNKTPHKGTNQFVKARKLGLPIPENGRKGKFEKEYKCSVCEQVFLGLKTFKEHLSIHKNDKLRNPDWSKFYGSHKIEETKCKFCERTFTSSSGLGLHEKCCPKNPNRVDGAWKGKKHSDETKKVISEKLHKVYERKSIWRTQIEKRKSYAEEYFDRCFPNLKQNFHVGGYFLDLADVEKKTYIEIDGEQHYRDPKVVEHDKVRTKRLEELGWKCLRRVRWSEFQKLTDSEKAKFIEDLTQQVSGTE